MHDETNDRLMKRLDAYTSDRKHRATSKSSDYADFILTARKKNMPWKEIAQVLKEEAGSDLSAHTLMMWYYRQKEV